MIYNVSCFGWKHFLPERHGNVVQHEPMKKEVVKETWASCEIYCTFYGNFCGF